MRVEWDEVSFTIGVCGLIFSLFEYLWMIWMNMSASLGRSAVKWSFPTLGRGLVPVHGTSGVARRIGWEP